MKIFGRTTSKFGLALVVLVAIVIVARLAAPSVAKWYINKNLKAGIRGYYGQIEDVDLKLILGQYTIEGLSLRKAASAKEVQYDQPAFLEIPKINFKVYWEALLNRALRGTIDIYQAQINLIHDPEGEKTQTGLAVKDKGKKKEEGDDGGWRTTADSMFPLTIENVRIHNSSVRFSNPRAKPAVDIKLNQLELRAENITNAISIDKKLPSSVRVTSNLAEGGEVEFSSAFNALVEPVAFNIDFNVQIDVLKRLNPFFNHYLNFDVTSGELNVSAEMAGNEKCLKGYIKPVFENLDILAEDEDYKGFKNFFVEQVVALTNFLIRNYPTDRTATKVEFAQRYENLSVNTWESVINLFKNAFVQAYKPQIDQEISKADANTGCPE